MQNQNEIDECIEKLQREAKVGGYNLNPKKEDLDMIISGYLENQAKLGYPACPCRLASGNYEEDKDIICPCDYRDDDISEFGQCYCSLYVDDEVATGQKTTQPIPERRPQYKSEKETKSDIEGKSIDHVEGGTITGFNVNVWRCPVCGYLCAKEQPPPKCPICGASRDRFELFIKKIA